MDWMLFIAVTAACWTIGYLFVAYGDNTGKDTFNKIGFAIFGLWVLWIVINGSGSGIDIEDTWRNSRGR